MINVEQKCISDETIQWRRLKGILEAMRDKDGIIRHLYMTGCKVTALPRGLEPRVSIDVKSPAWKFWEQGRKEDYLLGFRVESFLISTTSFHHVAKRVRSKTKTQTF